MIAAVGTALTSVIGWAGSVVTALVSETGELNELLPLFAIGVAVSATMLGVKIIKGFVWGA